MRQVDDSTLEALKGSRAGDKVTVYVWYDGRLAYPDPLPISSYAFDWDITRQVQKFTCEVNDKDGVLAPWILDDPLGVGGAELQVRYEVGGGGGGSPIRMGWYRIAETKPDERWRSYIIRNDGAVHPDNTLGPDRDLVFVSGGSKITLTAYDRALNGKNSRLLAPESPPVGTSPTIVSEIKRLMRDICPVVTTTGVVDRAVSPNLVYDNDRMNSVQDLCKRILCDYRMNGDGQLEIYSLAQSDPVATLEGGPGGLLMRVDRAQKLDGLYNIFVVDGTQNNPDGTTVPIRAIAVVTFGPLAVDGPHGRYPLFYSSNMIQTQDDAEEYAFQMMQTQLAGLTVDLVVTALPQPWLQQGEWVTVANPLVNGVALPLVGKVKAMALSGKGAPDSMVLTVACSYWDVQTAIAGVGRVQQF
jgi:hypothetical protein